MLRKCLVEDATIKTLLQESFQFVTLSLSAARKAITSHDISDSSRRSMSSIPDDISTFLSYFDSPLVMRNIEQGDGVFAVEVVNNSVGVGGGGVKFKHVKQLLVVDIASSMVKDGLKERSCARHIHDCVHNRVMQYLMFCVAYSLDRVIEL